jgi:hypothetical protein
VPSKWWGAAGSDATWTATLRDGATRPLQLTGLREVPAFCQSRLGIRTDYRGVPPPEREPTMPKDGIAVAGGVPVQPIDTVDKASPDWQRMQAAIADAFDDAEKDAAEAFLDWKHPWKSDERRKFPIELESFYRSTEKTSRGSWRVSYVEAVRRFPERPDDRGCGLITYAYGWVLERTGHDPKFALGARVTYCDRDAVSFLLPFGRLLMDNEVYWVYQLSSWTDEVYVVSRIRPDRVEPQAVVSGGSCPRRGAGRGRAE